MIDDFLKKFKEFVIDESLIKHGDKIILAVSGGSDSIVLLDAFVSIGPEYNLKFVVAHVNHSLRGVYADRDEEFVRKTAAAYTIDFFSQKFKVKEYAQNNNLSLEQAARIKRLNYLYTLRRELQYNKIAFGHTMDDAAETIIMNLFRGYGLRGLRGILPENDHCIHPLLFTMKQDITAYAKAKDLDTVEDETNQDITFLRNRIRHKILPVIKEQFGSGTIPSMYRSGKILTEIEKHLSYCTDQALETVILDESAREIILDINEFLTYFMAVKKNIIIRILEKMYGYYSFNYIEAVLELIERGRSNNTVEIGEKGIVVKYSDKIYFTEKQTKINKTEIKLNKWNLIPQCGIKIKCTLIKKIDKLKNNDKYREYVDFNTLHPPLMIRSWIEGDKFKPLGMSGTKKLHDFFIDEGVINFKRKTVPILTDTKNIIWIIGYRIHDQVKVNKNTTTILKLEAKRIFTDLNQ